MAAPTLSDVAEPERLRDAWQRVRKKRAAGGVDGMSVAEFERDAETYLAELSKVLRLGAYVPEPLKHGSVDKPGKMKKRDIGLPSVRDKVVQTTLARLLVDFYDPQLSNCSYAYRPGKGTVKAIGRVRDFLKRKNVWAAPVDIVDFFDTIHHDTCLSILERRITDPGVVRLVKLYLSTGVLKHDRWEDTFDGVPQGGVLSPVMSNIYLNELDQFLHQRNTVFVRYADDILLMATDRNLLLKEIASAEDFLKKTLRLMTHSSDDPAANISRGFSFLGIFFHRDRIRIDYNRMDEKVNRIRGELAGRRDFRGVITRLNDFFTGVRRYYARLMPNSHQLDTLESRALAELSGFIARGKAEGFVETKKMCREHLERLVFIRDKTANQKKPVIDKIIEDGFTRFQETDTQTAQKADNRSVQSAVGKKKQQYARKLATETELVVSKFGHFIGYTRYKFTVKHKGVVVAAVPKNRLRRLVINSRGVTISSDCIHQCCKRGISIELLSDRGEPFAMLYSPQFAITQASAEQLGARDTPTGAHLACEFLKGKARNQINMLKYFNKYLKRVEPEKGEVVAANVIQMQALAKNLKPGQARDEPRETFRNRLMGFEGNISTYYWASVRQILPPELPFEGRVTRGARDTVNSVINYGYGILYNRVQQALADAGAALHISFLHEPQGKKPTLVFDLIEEFRQFIVDRTVIAMFNRQEPLNTDKRGYLTEKTRQLIVKNVQERLGSYIRWRRKQWRCEDVILHQARLVMHHVRGEKKYRAFIGRY